MNPVDLRELKISRHNEILTPNHSFYFRPLCAIFSISEPPARTKKATNLLFASRSNKKNRFARIEPSWFLTWRFLSSPILEICIFFLPILSSGFWLSVTSSFVGGLPASFKLTSSDWGVVRCRSVKWTDSNNKVSSLNHKQVPATSLDTVKGRNAKLSTSPQDYNSYNSRVENNSEIPNVCLRQIWLQDDLTRNSSCFVFEALVYCVKWCHGIYDQWLSPQILAWMISLGKHSSRRFTLRARNSLWSPKTGNFSSKATSS